MFYDALNSVELHEPYESIDFATHLMRGLGLARLPLKKRWTQPLATGYRKIYLEYTPNLGRITVGVPSVRFPAIGLCWQSPESKPDPHGDGAHPGLILRMLLPYRVVGLP